LKPSLHASTKLLPKSSLVLGSKIILAEGIKAMATLIKGLAVCIASFAGLYKKRSHGVERNRRPQAMRILDFDDAEKLTGIPSF